MHFSFAGLESQRLLELVNRIIRPAFLQEGVAEIVIRFGFIRLDAQRFLILRDRLVQFSLFGESQAEMTAGEIIVRRASKRMRPQCYAVGPIIDLLPGANHQCREHTAHQNANCRAVDSPLGNQPG